MFSPIYFLEFIFSKFFLFCFFARIILRHVLKSLQMRLLTDLTICPTFNQAKKNKQNLEKRSHEWVTTHFIKQYIFVNLMNQTSYFKVKFTDQTQDHIQCSPIVFVRIEITECTISNSYIEYLTCQIYDCPYCLSISN